MDLRLGPRVTTRSCTVSSSRQSTRFLISVNTIIIVLQCFTRIINGRNIYRTLVYNGGDSYNFEEEKKKTWFLNFNGSWSLIGCLLFLCLFHLHSRTLHGCDYLFFVFFPLDSFLFFLVCGLRLFRLVS